MFRRENIWSGVYGRKTIDWDRQQLEEFGCACPYAHAQGRTALFRKSPINIYLKTNRYFIKMKIGMDVNSAHYSSVTANSTTILKGVQQKKDLELLLIELVNDLTDEEERFRMANEHAGHPESKVITADSATCCRGVCANLLPLKTAPQIVVAEYEDLLSPNYLTLESLRRARKDGCNLYVIFLANALQTTRLLRFGDRYRVLDTRARYIILHDFRLFHSNLHYIWKRIVNVIFLRYHTKTQSNSKGSVWFEISTVPYPNPIKNVLIPIRLDTWSKKGFHYKRPLFSDKTVNLKGETVNVVFIEHVPAVIVAKLNTTNEISGVEIEILNTLAEKMNFVPRLYQPVKAEFYRWGEKQSNGSFSGLLGEMVNGKADIALGNLQYTPYHLELTDLTIPYISQCLTFLTPEALTDNSWKTLILPFKLYMWITVLLVLLITGTIFWGLANFYIKFLNYKKTNELSSSTERKTVLALNDKEAVDLTTGEKPVALYLFGEIINSILYTYGMLLVVSLPKLPSGWSIRLLTGWYWLYCILLVVAYRASMTAILANPAPRVTIDTLNELVDSKIACGGWGTETKKFFVESMDETTRTIGARFQIINNPYLAVKKVAQGVYAYYDNEYYLKYLSLQKQNVDLVKKDMEYDNSTWNTTEIENGGNVRSLHIMSDCVVNIPVSIALHKNSPLKPLTDKYVRRIFEVGLVEKWLNDAMYPIRSAINTETAEVKALMNLKKLYGALVALAFGYFLSAICLIGELIHWHLIIKRDPKFDKYAIHEYYKNK
ncbi:Glutamate receptor ionotropic, delta-2 [Eumeta japonica]|uniref:Glutamate receptor ionotropic, delta-2 n=1 Tax=Eumeta variegata TaxID=151549 RepID=A0A4C1TT58_EUMVA|nr:Glutamate receptor ionotropic, delta-2 [Eumeta japonica]